MKSSKVLKLVLEALKSSRGEYHEDFLCLIIEELRGKHTNIYKNLQKIFNKDIGTVTVWLAKNHSGFRYFRNKYYATKHYFDAVRDYRIAWVAWLIPQYESVGD